MGAPIVDLETRFTHHPPNRDQFERCKMIRMRAHELAKSINDKCSDSREKSLAITKLEEAVFWAEASIARNE